MKSEQEIKNLLDTVNQGLKDLEGSKYERTQFTLHIKKEILEWILDKNA